VALVVQALGLLARSRTGEGRAKVPMPWFVLGFVALITLAAMGLETDARKLPARGPRPFLLGLIAFFFISGFSLLLIRIIRR
jgi:uncharacterized membrane protein YadS